MNLIQEQRTRRLTYVAIAAATALATGACGDDGDSASGEQSAFCEATIEAGQLFNEGPDLDDSGEPTQDDLEEFAESLRPRLDTVRENAPEDLRDEIDEVVRAVEDALSGGDTSATETPEFAQADAAISDYVFDNCDLRAKHEIVAVEYEFQDVPDSIEAGDVGIRLQNDGEEVHELVVFRIDDDEDRPIEELIELPDSEVEDVIEFAGFTFAAPGESSALVADLDDPGRYAIVCFVPVGTTSAEDFQEGGEDSGPPHVAEGMYAEFEVR